MASIQATNEIEDDDMDEDPTDSDRSNDHESEFALETENEECSGKSSTYRLQIGSEVAMTIHKSSGQTLQQLAVDSSTQCFGHSQLLCCLHTRWEFSSTECLLS